MTGSGSGSAKRLTRLAPNGAPLPGNRIGKHMGSTVAENRHLRSYPATLVAVDVTPSRTLLSPYLLPSSWRGCHQAVMPTWLGLGSETPWRLCDGSMQLGKAALNCKPVLAWPSRASEGLTTRGGQPCLDRRKPCCPST